MMGVLLLAAAAVTNVVSNVAELKAVVPKLKWGSTLVLKDGVYDLSAWEAKGKDPVFLDLTMHANLRSESGRPEKCVLLGPGERKPGRCLALDGDGSSVSGVTIENFYVKGSGAAVLSPAKPGGRLTVTDCRFVDCVATGSGGALAGYGLVAVGCTFERCRALNGAGGAGDRLHATRCRFIDCSAKGAGGAGGGGAVAYGATKDCIFERCTALTGYGVVRNATSEHNVFLDCGGNVGYAMDFRDTKFVRSGSVVNSSLFNCKFDACHYPTNGPHSLISLCTLTNCTISGTTGGDPKRWNSGLLASSTLVDCLIENDRSVRVEVKDPSGSQKNPVFIETAPDARKGWDPEDIKRRRAAAKEAQERKLAAEAKSGVHEIMRIDFDDAKPRKNGGAYGGFWCGIWGDSKCEFSLVPGEGGKGQAMRCNLRGMVGGQLQVFSAPWTMWQNSWYRLRFRARGVDHPGQVGVTVRKYGYPWSMLAWPSKKFHPENEWKEYVLYKKSQHDVSSGFGIMLELGDVGCVDFDWFVVERLDYDPTLREAAPNRNPPVRGNLLPHGAFETEDDNFYVFSRAATAIWPVWKEARMVRVPGGHDGGFCVRFPPVGAMPDEKISGASRTTSSRTLMTKPVPVAAGRNYRLSCWYRLQAPPGATRTVAYCDFRAASGKKWSMGRRFCVNRLGWQKLEVVSATPVPENVSQVQISIEINGYDISLDELDFRMVEEEGEGTGEGEMPYEFGLAFDCADPATTPRIVTWGEELPLKLVAMRKRRDEGRGTRDEGHVAATLRVTAYPDKVTVEKKIALKPDEEMKLSVDPKANGILRVELVPDDPKAGVPIEKVMARLPKPRPTGPESYFGTHLRMCPYFVNYAAAIGIKWQRLHDCSNMCKMKWGNPEPGVYQWADEIVDYMRAKNINILAMPDYPSAYIMPTNAQGQVVYDNEGYRAWCRELAKHYKGRINHFEIWNEPYMPYFYKRDAKEYGKTFLAGARGIREGNPDAKVIGWCTEFTTPKYVNPFIRDYPVAEKPDYNSVHYYYTSVPGDGDLSYDRIVRNVKDTFGERAGSELWNTEGNLALTHTFYSRMRTFDRVQADRGVAFGVRGWAESIAAGFSKVFLYTTHNTDSYGVGGLMTLIDFDRAPTPEAAATAVTAYFIDGRRVVKGLAPIDGCKYQAFVGGGYSVALIWDDVLKEGRKTIRLQKDLQLFDAMGNRLVNPVELGMIPVFAVARGEDVVAMMRQLSFDDKPKK